MVPPAEDSALRSASARVGGERITWWAWSAASEAGPAAAGRGRLWQVRRDKSSARPAAVGAGYGGGRCVLGTEAQAVLSQMYFPSVGTTRGLVFNRRFST